MKRPDLLILVAIWEFLVAFCCLIGIAAIATFALPDAVGWRWDRVDTGAVFGLSIGMLVLLCGAGLSIAGGIGLLRGNNWGRIISIVVGVFSLFWFPVGTAIGILMIIYLARNETREYFEAGQ